LLAALPACGQHFSFGIIGGGIAAGGLDPLAQNSWDGKRYSVGATAEVTVPLPRFSVEVDALLQHTGARAAGCVFTYCSYVEVRANIFEFPALVKYRAWRSAFVGAGPAYHWVRHGRGGALSWRNGQISPGEVVDMTLHRNRAAMAAETNAGVVAGGGVELRAGRLVISPQFRYTRWASRYWEFSGSRGFFTGSNLNQAEGLVGVRF
jgi:hypothetical protein